LGRPQSADDLVREAVRANVRASVDHLRHGSDLLEKLIQETGLLVVGAEYSLETGHVDFFDNIPSGAQQGLFGTVGLVQ
jgi:carbonic anhydrase